MIIIKPSLKESWSASLLPVQSRAGAKGVGVSLTFCRK